MIYSCPYFGLYRFGPNWVHLQGAVKSTERPLKTPTVRNSRKFTSRLHSSTDSSEMSSCRGSLRLDPTDEGFRTYPENFFGGRREWSFSVMLYANLFSQSLKTCFVRKGSLNSCPSVTIRGQRISNGTRLSFFAKSESTKKVSRRVPGSSSKHWISTGQASLNKNLYFRNRRNFCLRNIVWTLHDVWPELFLEGVLDLHRRVLRSPVKVPNLNCLRDEYMED